MKKKMVVIAINKLHNEYILAYISNHEVEVKQVNHEALYEIVKTGNVMNYEIDIDGKIRYTQGSENRLEIGKEEARFIILQRIKDFDKTLGFDVLVSSIYGDMLGSTKLMRISYEDTVKLITTLTCVNAKYTESLNIISCLYGNFEEEQIKQTPHKIKKDFVTSQMRHINSNLANMFPDINNTRLKEYEELYSNYMLGDNSEVLKQYKEDSKLDILKNRLENGRYKKSIKKALVYGIMIATVGGILGNAAGVIDVMPSSYIQVNKNVESPTTKAEAIAMIETASKIKVDYTFGWTNGTVYADGVKVAKLESKFIGVLDSVKLNTLSGEEISNSKQHLSILRNFTLESKTGNKTELNGNINFIAASLTQTDTDGNKIADIKSTAHTLYTMGSIKDAGGNIIYNIVKEPVGKTFTIEKVGKSNMNNSEAIVLAGLLGISSPKGNSN